MHFVLLACEIWYSNILEDHFNFLNVKSFLKISMLLSGLKYLVKLATVSSGKHSTLLSLPCIHLSDILFQGFKASKVDVNDRLANYCDNVSHLILWWCWCVTRWKMSHWWMVVQIRYEQLWIGYSQTIWTEWELSWTPTLFQSPTN